MAWRMARSLDRLLAQVNTRWPRRSKASDGGIGNAEHSARESDHNPDTDGVVKARDFTHDPASGCDSYKLAQALLDSRDPRIKYIISNHRIASGGDGPSPWKWRDYSGKNPHDHHCHISVKKSAKFFDDAGDWNLDGVAGASPPAPPKGASPAVSLPRTLMPRERAPGRKVMTGTDVKKCQLALGFGGKDVTSTYDAVTVRAVENMQRRNKIIVDGVCGPQSWKLLLGVK